MDISFTAILVWFKTLGQSILTWFDSFFTWIIDATFDKIASAVIYVDTALFSQTFDAVTYFVAAINWVTATSLSYITDALNFPFGIKLIISALLLRFVLRRLPIIG